MIPAHNEHSQKFEALDHARDVPSVTRFAAELRRLTSYKTKNAGSPYRGFPRFLLSSRLSSNHGGEAGIRTLEGDFSHPTRLAGECLQPLGHLTTRRLFYWHRANMSRLSPPRLPSAPVFGDLLGAFGLLVGRRIRFLLIRLALHIGGLRLGDLEVILIHDVNPQLEIGRASCRERV